MTDSAITELAKGHKARLLFKAVGRLIHGLATGIGYTLFGAALVGFLHDRILVSESLEMHDHVQVLTELRKIQDLEFGPEQEQDFDGDGTVDRVVITEYRVDRAFGLGLTHMLSVYSGRTDELLLAHGILWSSSFRGWYGDYDNNGTMDIVVRKGRIEEMLGYIKDAR